MQQQQRCGSKTYVGFMFAGMSFAAVTACALDGEPEAGPAAVTTGSEAALEPSGVEPSVTRIGIFS